NADGSIPAYTGGLPLDTAPAGYTPGDSVRPDPFAGEKPLLVIDQSNLQQHREQLTAVTQELLRRYADYRVEVYPSHRSVSIAPFLRENTRKNITDARSVEGGIGMENVLPGVPFPIPANGLEAMWNHLFRNPGHTGYDIASKFDSWNVDANGSPVLATRGEVYATFPLIDPQRIDQPASGKDVYYRLKVRFTAPARRVGEAILVQDSINPLAQPRRAWQYLPGQRRVKLAPDISYDTPNPATAGASVYDDSGVYNGAMDRFDWKLLGKRELYIPYNAYRLTYERDVSRYLKPGHLDPQFVRWELHRVWVVEATLKPGARHVYQTRRFYLDEDSWTAVASDEYDQHGQLYRGAFAFIAPSWDVQSANGTTNVIYDLISGAYNISGVYGPHGGIKYIKPLSQAQWTPESLAGAGVR
ncbi:MAG TPA: DUF1329 domain-containing protein, partial [Pseudomonas sp.]|nr:DUF1329 domain-containing protein [Pseudomonas sp.]